MTDRTPFKKAEHKLLQMIAERTGPITGHQRNHDGDMFTVHQYASAVASNASLGTLLVVDNQKEMHALLNFAGQGDSEVFVFENPVYTNKDAALVITRKNREVEAEGIKPGPVTTAFTLVSTTSDGIELDHFFVPGGSGGNSQGGSNLPDRGDEFIFAPGKEYLVKVFNRGGAAKILSQKILFYEED